MLILINVRQFHAFIPVGWYIEEIQTTTEVWIDVSIGYESESIQDDLSQTIDYAQIHDILHRVAKKQFRLLESFGESVLNEIQTHFHYIGLKEAEITIHKAQIMEKGSDVGNQSITLKKRYT